MDEWAIRDASRTPPILMKTGDNRPPQKLMEDSAPTPSDKPWPVKPLDDPDFIGAIEALKRASEKAIDRAHAAGLEPVVAEEPDEAEGPMRAELSLSGDAIPACGAGRDRRRRPRLLFRVRGGVILNPPFDICRRNRILS